jgi:hypothetical protein
MGDEQHGRAERLAQRGQDVAHLGAGDLVERGERLVHQQDRRPERQRPDQRHPLLHATRQLVGVGVEEPRQPDPIEQLDRRHRGGRASGAPVDVEQQAGVGADRPPRQQRRRLRHPTDLLGGASARRGLAIDDDAAGARCRQARDDAQQRRLATAARSEQRDDLTRLDVEIDRCQRFGRAEATGDAGELDGRHGGGRRRVSDAGRAWR